MISSAKCLTNHFNKNVNSLTFRTPISRSGSEPKLAQKKLKGKTHKTLQKSTFAKGEPLSDDVLNEVKLQIFELFGEETWIPRGGISKNGNIYITFVVKNNAWVDSWYSKRKGLEPRS